MAGIGSRYMLDTNVASHLLRGGNAALIGRMQVQPLTTVCISVVTEAELRYGLARKPAAKALHGAVSEFLVRVQALPWDSDAAARYAELRAALEAAGTPLGNMDTLIAAHALAAGATLVTNDQAFRHVTGLMVEDWTRA